MPFFEEKMMKSGNSLLSILKSNLSMCAVMRRVFLSWERITSYLPQHAIMPQALEVEARKELPAAVLIR